MNCTPTDGMAEQYFITFLSRAFGVAKFDRYSYQLRYL